MRNLFVSCFLILVLCLSSYSQTDKELGLHSGGGLWNFYPAIEKNDSLKNVLLIGDSVMNGFRQFVIDSLKKTANVDCWLTPFHLKSEHLFADLQKVVSSNNYDVIQFNIGLHGWPKGRILDDEYVPLLEKYVKTIIENAKGAKLIWASITPVTEQDEAALNKEINPIIAERNKLAAGVMRKNNIVINDLYGLVVDKLNLAQLDKFHWKPEGYQLMANQTIIFIQKELGNKHNTPKKDHSNVQYTQRLSVEKLKEWQDLKYGMFIHFGMSTYLGEELPDGSASVDTYAPTDLDVAQWVRVAKEAGMQYAVLTAKHVAGHCLWPSAYTGYDVSNSIDTTDVVGEFVKECRKQGIQPGIYYCSWDNHHKFGSLMPGESENYGGALVTPTEDNPGTGAPYTTHLYQNFMTAQIDEILERYSPLVEFWIDIPIILGNGYRTFIYNHITQKYPDMLVIMNHGLIKKGGDIVFLEDKAWPTDVFTLEKFYTGKPYDPIRKIKGKEIYFPAETCLSIGNEWFWEEDDKVKPMDDLVNMFESSLENKINLLLNVPPDRTGQIPEKWIKPLMELKERMKDKL